MEGKLTPKFRAFTVRRNVRLNEIITDIGISIPEPIDLKRPPSFIYNTNALWDTGASNSVITQKTAKILNLIPIRKVKVFHGGGESNENVYLVKIYLPNKFNIPNIHVTECSDISGRFGVLIGMDIICFGDFSITNVNKKTVASFRMPSIKEIDYVKEAKISKA